MVTMTEERTTTLRKIHCVVGGLCAFVIAGQLPIFGNMGAYVESYLISRGDLALGTTWFIQAVIGCYLAAVSILMLSAGYMNRRVGTAWGMFLGLAISMVARVVTFWTVQISTVATLLTFGVLNGVGSGFILGFPYAAANKHKFDNPGLIYGIITSGQSVSGLIFNFIITGFLNPDNVEPDIASSNTRHFSQPEILDRVPYLFLLLSAVYLVLCPIAVTGMREPPPAENIALEDCEKALPAAETGYLTSKSSSETDYSGIKEASDEQLNKDITDDEQGVTAVTTKELFFRKDFYLVWFFGFCGALSSTVCLGFYKEMGLTQYPDDVYMAWLVSVSVLGITITRPLGGLLADKTGLKLSVLLQSGVNAVMCAFWFWSLLAGRSAYFLWTFLLFCNIGTGAVFLSLATKMYFGNQQFYTNYGCVYTSVAVAALVAPFLTSAALQYSGWVGLTLILSGVAFAGMLGCLLLPEDKTE